MGVITESSFLKINGKRISSFKGYTVEFDSLAGENSGRTDDGEMHIDWILRCIRKVNIQLPPMTDDELGDILSLVQGKEYDLTYKDPIKGIHTINCYTSKSSSPLYNAVLYNGLWVGASFNAIELKGE